METYKATSSNGEVETFKALNDYEAKHYIINHFDCSQSWTFKVDNQRNILEQPIDLSSKLYEVESGIESVIVWLSHDELKKYHNDEPFIGICEATGESLRFNTPWNCMVEESN